MILTYTILFITTQIILYVLICTYIILMWQIFTWRIRKIIPQCRR